MSAVLSHVQRLSERYIEVFGPAGALLVMLLLVLMVVIALWCVALAVEALIAWRVRVQTEREDRVVAAAVGRRRPRAPGLASTRRKVS